MLASLLLGISAASSAAVCPTEIQTRQQASAPAGWKVIQRPGISVLSGFVVYYDDPSTGREWAPDRVKKVGAKHFLTYQLPKQTRQVWVDCSYTFGECLSS